MVNKKATDRKKLLKMQDALKKVNEEIEHLRSLTKVHVFEKVKFTMESKRLEMVERMTWDAGTKVTQMCSQLR